MSLRRESAELRRALELSTQQVDALAHLPSYSLSSAPSDDSRDFELRPAHHIMSTTPHTPHNQSYSYTALAVLSPSPPPQVARALNLSTGASRPTPGHVHRADMSPLAAQTPTSRIGTFATPARDAPRSSVSEIGTFPQTLETPPAARPRCEVVIPRPRMSSPDPIDCLRSDREKTPAEVLVDASRSSGTGPVIDLTESLDADPGRRSARVRDNKEKEMEAKRKEQEAKAERRRKREAEKARLAAEEAVREREEAEDGGEYVPGRPEKKRKKAEKKKPAPKTSQTKTSQAKSTKSSQAKSDKSKSSQASEKPSEEASSSAAGGNLIIVEETSSASKVPGTSGQLSPVTSSEKRLASSDDRVAAVPDSSPSSPAPKLSAPKSSTPKSSAPPKPSSAEPSSSAKASEPSSPIKLPPKAPPKAATPTPDPSTPLARKPLQPVRSTPGSRGSPYNWKTPRSDLSSVLANFPGAKRTGMSKRTRIASLHTTIGPPAKVLPPPPPKRKKVEEEEDDDSDTEGKVKVGSREWLMMED